VFSSPEDLFQYVVKHPVKGYLCSICEKYKSPARVNVRNHVESKHFPNTFEYACEFCGKIMYSKNYKDTHISMNHKFNDSKPVPVTDQMFY